MNTFLFPSGRCGGDLAVLDGQAAPSLAMITGKTAAANPYVDCTCRISGRAWDASLAVASAASPVATYACVDTWLTDFRDDLPKIDVPSLAMHGTEDPILPYEATPRRLPGPDRELRLVTVEGGPHNIGCTHSEEVNTALLEFLAA